MNKNKLDFFKSQIPVGSLWSGDCEWENLTNVCVYKKYFIYNISYNE